MRWQQLCATVVSSGQWSISRRHQAEGQSRRQKAEDRRLKTSVEMIETTERRGPAIEPREIQQEGDSGLRITWADDCVCRYNAAELRRACPCAQCVNEWTGQRVLKPEAVSEDLVIADISVVGRYALNFRWSDGHETGIYSFRYLRELGER
jgi:DUF971 family protein